MADEVNKLLGPFPILQLVFGLVVLGFGAYMIVRGTQQKKDPLIHLEDKRVEWEAMERLKSIDEGIQQIVRHQGLTLENIRMVGEIMRQQTEQLKALSAAIWNRGV